MHEKALTTRLAFIDEPDHRSLLFDQDASTAGISKILEVLRL